MLGPFRYSRSEKSQSQSPFVPRKHFLVHLFWSCLLHHSYPIEPPSTFKSCSSPLIIICTDFSGISRLRDRASLFWQCYFKCVVSDLRRDDNITVMSVTWASHANSQWWLNCALATNLGAGAWSDLQIKTLTVIFQGYIYTDTKMWVKHLNYI